MKQIITVASLFLFITLWGQTNKSLNNDLKTFQKDNYSIQYPKKWIVESPGPLMESFCLNGPNENEYVYVNLIIEENSKKWEGKFNDYLENELNEYSGIQTIVKKEQIDNNIYRIEFNTTINEDVHKSIRYFYLRQNTIYLLTFCASDAVYKSYINEGESIISTFKVSNI
jgi:hypothetical protein